MFSRLLVLAGLVFTMANAAKEPAGPPRYAVLRFENLTPSRARDWIGRAASSVLAKQLGAIGPATLAQASQPFAPHSNQAPGISSEMTAARLAGATRVLTGYYEAAGAKLNFTAVEEDAASGKTIRTATASGTLLECLQSLAKQFTASPQPPPTTNEAALQAYALASDAASAPDALYARAIQADPNFADAYIAWSESALARRDRPALQNVLEQARAHHLPGDSTARLELALALLSTDPAARLAPLLRIANANPADLFARRQLADAELAAHRFSDAAAHYGQLANPAAADLFNPLAYSRMFAGDEKGAMAAIEQYRTLRPQDANAADSGGDVQFYFGRFAEAEKSYLQAAGEDPNFNQGLEIWKAARARLMTGDTSGASALFERFREARVKEKDASLPFRVAEWQYLTGARAAGVEAMLKTATKSDGALQPLALTQAAIWELQMGKRAEAARDAEAAMKAGQNPSVIPAAIVRFSASAPATPEVLQARAQGTFHGEGSEPIQILAVAYALWFSGRYAEAAPLWKQIYEVDNPSDQGTGFLYAGAWKEAHGEARDETLALLKTNPIPPVTLNPSFESLYFPKLLEWRGDHATYLKLTANIPAPAK